MYHISMVSQLRRLTMIHKDIWIEESIDVERDTAAKMKMHHSFYYIVNKVWSKRKLVGGIICVMLVLTCISTVVYHRLKIRSNMQLGQAKFMGELKPWDMRLPKWIFPRHYDIVLDIDMEADRFKGNVIINVVVTRDTNAVMLHMVNLTITNVLIKNSITGSYLPCRNHFPYSPFEFYVIEMNEFLKKGCSYDIEVKFNGKMRSDLSGFYTSYYIEGNQKRKVASTFFSPISARKVFPCFDEPLFKANFSLTLIYSDQYSALSNMPVYSTLHQENRVTTTFYQTLKMSTYLLCWVISDYKGVVETNFTNPQIKGWAPNSKLSDLNVSLNVTSKLLRFYEEYFNISYPLKKLDLIAVPAFGPGAMENWGIITFRPERLLISKSKSSDDDRQKSFQIIAHELVHQWFGNLVTMEFWTDAWLKEGFANYGAAIGGDQVDKTMGLKEQMLTVFMLPALKIDSYSTSHPISTSVQTPSEIREVFDTITYDKGSCIVQMLHHYIGDECFRQGLQKYLNTYSYRNAVQDDLWKELNLISGEDVKSVMETWTLQLGYPVIFLRRINSTHVFIEQNRFSLDPPNIVIPKSPFQYLWQVPIIFMSPRSKRQTTYLLKNKTATVAIPKKYLILNPDHSFYYRVNYDEKSLSAIKKILINEPGILSAQDRTGFISDQFSFVIANLTKADTFLSLLSYLKNESNYYPWEVAFTHLTYIKSLIESEDIIKKFNLFIGKLINKAIQRVDWEKSSSINEDNLQMILLQLACEHDLKEVVTLASQYYARQIVDQPFAVKRSLQQVVIDCAISHGPQFYWDFTFLKYKQGCTNCDSLLNSLAATQNALSINKLLNFSLDSDTIGPEKVGHLLGKISRHSAIGRELCWSFIKKNWKKIIQFFQDKSLLLPKMLSSVLETFSSEKDLVEIETFFLNKDFGSSSQILRQSFNIIKSNIEWKERNIISLSKWLNEQ